MTTDEFVKQWQTLAVGGEGALTVEAICQQTGLGRSTVHNRLREAVRADLMEVVWVRRTSIIGKPCLSPAYRVKANGKAKRKA